MKQYQSIHSFTRRPVATQIIAYLILIVQFLVFTTCLQNNIASQIARVILIVIYYLSFSGLVIAGAVTSCTDPSDQLIRGSDTQKTDTKFKLFCQICRSAVNGDTRHCKVCNICVVGFDHHCVWINNCIGSNNYASFAVMIGLVALTFITYLSAVLTVWLQRNWQAFLPAMVITWSFSFLTLIFTILVLALISFHIFLKCIGKTTYEYLITKSKERASVVPVNNQPHEVSEQSLEPSKSNMKMASQYHFGSFQTEALPRGRQSSSSNANQRVSMIFQDKSEQKSRKSESQKHLSIGKQQLIQNQALQVDSHKGEQKSEKETNGDVYLKRNKSLDYLLGKIEYNQPDKINYHSTFNPGRRLQKEAVIKLRESKHR